MTQQTQTALTPEVKAMVGVTGEVVEAWGVVDGEYLRRFYPSGDGPGPPVLGPGVRQDYSLR